MSVKRAFFGIFQKLTLFCCAMFFGFSNAFSANLPAGYTELEYIESTGTQYIDTGIVGKSGVSVEAKFMLTTEANGSLFGNRQTDNTRFWPAMWWKGSGASVWQWNATVNVDTLAGTVNKNTLYTTYFVSNSSGWTLDVNGERVSSGTQVGTNTNNMWMFGTNDGRTNTLQYPFIGKAYSAKIWQNGTLVRDFIPAKNSSGVVGMYDTVNNVFYQNAGTGEFTAGPVVPENAIKIATTAYNAARFNPVVNDLNSTVATIRDIVTNTINQTAAIASLQADKQTRPDEQCPAGKKCLLVETEENGVIVPHWYEIIENIYGLPTGYTALEYIESTGTQYIDTGVKANLNTKAEGVFEIPSGDVGQLFGSYDAGAYFRFYVPASSLKANIFDGVGLQTSLLPEDVSRGTKIKITLDKTGLYVGNKTFAYNGTPSAFTATSNIYIGMTSSYTGGTVSEGKVYSFKLYNNDAIVRDFVPAKRDSDSAIGMYDLADPNPATAFYTNSGTGTFSAGQEI